MHDESEHIETLTPTDAAYDDHDEDVGTERGVNGGMPFRRLPPWVQEKLRNANPWGGKRTREDKFVQQFFLGYFVAKNPDTQRDEIWVADPPGCFDAISFKKEIPPEIGYSDALAFLIYKADRNRSDLNFQATMDAMERTISRRKKENREIVNTANEDQRHRMAVKLDTRQFEGKSSVKFDGLNAAPGGA